ncbi:MAG: (deoxy)nucleoside triphosphate pyrophosphohydrolase [Pseudomonadota bacterium]
MSEPVDVVCALIEAGDEVLIARRGPGGATGGKWEFPGGKVQPGESPAEALIREIAEELDCTVTVGAALETNVHRYPNLSIRLLPYLCTISRGAVVAREHAEIAWVTKAELALFDWADADLPVVAAYAHRP